MGNEKIDLYDNDRLPLNIVKELDDKLEDGENRLSIHVCIFNSKGEMLIQQRVPTKRKWSNLWDVSVGGGVKAGETSRDGAKRELFEELGITYDFSNERPYLTINFNHGFDDIYFLNMDIDPETLVLQKEEVSKAKWASKEEIERMIDGGEFIPFVKSQILALFDLRKQRGMIIM